MLAGTGTSLQENSGARPNLQQRLALSVSFCMLELAMGGVEKGHKTKSYVQTHPEALTQVVLL